MRRSKFDQVLSLFNLGEASIGDDNLIAPNDVWISEFEKQKKSTLQLLFLFCLVLPSS